ncbi:hypothetical protein ACP70R_018160 [Stipagrostis hirtigluma subsp. patula]
MPSHLPPAPPTSGGNSRWWRRRYVAVASDGGTRRQRSTMASSGRRATVPQVRWSEAWRARCSKRRRRRSSGHRRAVGGPPAGYGGRGRATKAGGTGDGATGARSPAHRGHPVRRGPPQDAAGHAQPRPGPMRPQQVPGRRRGFGCCASFSASAPAAAQEMDLSGRPLRWDLYSRRAVRLRVSEGLQRPHHLLRAVREHQGHPVNFRHGGRGARTSPGNRRFFDSEFYRIVLRLHSGASRSTPNACFKNTTWDLVADIERLREHLDIPNGRFLVVHGKHLGPCVQPNAP